MTKKNAFAEPRKIAGKCQSGSEPTRKHAKPVAKPENVIDDGDRLSIMSMWHEGVALSMIAQVFGITTDETEAIITAKPEKKL